MNTSTQPATLTARLERDGWQPGPPAHVAAFALAVDVGLCREWQCPCGQVGQTYHPLHRGRRYKAIAVCPRCGQEEEV